jgi:hypothetical protein
LNVFNFWSRHYTDVFEHVQKSGRQVAENTSVSGPVLMWRFSGLAVGRAGDAVSASGVSKGSGLRRTFNGGPGQRSDRRAIPLGSLLELSVGEFRDPDREALHRAILRFETERSAARHAVAGR